MFQHPINFVLIFWVIICLIFAELIGGPSWNPNCIELEKGEWVGCPVWDDHKYEVISESCLADCKGAGFFEKVAAEVKQMAMKVRYLLSYNLLFCLIFYSVLSSGYFC